MGAKVNYGLHMSEGFSLKSTIQKSPPNNTIYMYFCQYATIDMKHLKSR